MNRLIKIVFLLWICIHGQSQIHITFRVDMKEPAEIGLIEPSSGDRVILRGSFNNWQGNDFVLNDMDGDYIYCGSTNGHFCALLKYNKIGKFVGTPSGATYKCNAGRDTEISLDHTRIILTFGRTTFEAAVKGMDKSKPILPDYPVQPTYNDFLKGRDVFLETALRLIDEN